MASIEIIRANTIEPVDIPLQWTGAPVHCEPSMHRQPIAAEIPTETTQLRRTGALNFGDPLFKLGSASLADEHHEALRQPTTRGQLAAVATQIGEKQTFGVVKLRASTQEQPTQRLWTGQDASDAWWRFRFAPILYESSHRALAAAIAECLKFVVQKRSNVTTILPTAHEIRSESIQATWSLSRRPG